MISHGRTINGNLDITDANESMYSMTSNSYFEAVLANQLEDYIPVIDKLTCIDIDNYKEFCMEYISNIEKQISIDSNNIDKFIYNIIVCTRERHQDISDELILEYIYEQFFEIDNKELQRIKIIYNNKCKYIHELYHRIFDSYLNDIRSCIMSLNKYFTNKYYKISDKVYISEIECEIIIGKNQYELPYNIINLWQMLILYNIDIVIISHDTKKGSKEMWLVHEVDNLGKNINEIVLSLYTKYKNIMLLCCNPHHCNLDCDYLFASINGPNIYYAKNTLLAECKTNIESGR